MVADADARRHCSQRINVVNKMVAQMRRQREADALPVDASKVALAKSDECRTPSQEQSTSALVPVFAEGSSQEPAPLAAGAQFATASDPATW